MSYIMFYVYTKISKYHSLEDICFTKLEILNDFKISDKYFNDV